MSPMRCSGQMLILAGTILAVSIIVLASIIASLSTSTAALDKSSYLIPDFRLIKEKFGLALKEYMGDDFQAKKSDNVWLSTYIAHISGAFTLIEARYDMYFHAKYVDLNMREDGVIVLLNLSCRGEWISEKVDYYIV